MKAKFLYAGLVVLAVLPWAVDSRYVFHVATMIAIMVPLALSMNLLMKVGQLSLAQTAFMGLGAYGSALLTMQLGIPSLLSLLLGGVIASLTALVFGPVFLRVKGIYFVLLTFAFGQVINLIFQEWTTLFGGNSGLYGIPKLSIFGFQLTAVHHYYLLGLLLAFTTYFGLRTIEKSEAGAILQALNEDEMLSRSIGANALAWRVGVFVLSAFIAGISGGVYAFYVGLLSPDNFSFHQSVDLIVINVVGGMGSVLGPVLGAIVIVPLPEVLRDAMDFQMLVYAVCVIVFLTFFKKGLVSLFDSRKGAP
jgi:branched-chain amino acid transport system permease protein